jgi:hypothetical protein
MPKTKDMQDVDRRQIGVLIDFRLWRKFKALAVMRDTTAGELLEEAMRYYLKNLKEESLQLEILNDGNEGKTRMHTCATEKEKGGRLFED